jgi:GTP1/Obg family GTP-binding protein
MIIIHSRSQVQEYMDYNTAVQHAGSIYSQHLEIPKSLLKIEDLHESYRELLYFKYELEHLNTTHNTSKDNEEFLFKTQNEKIKRI